MDLGSDQTSCHNPFNGGYYPVQLSFTEAQSLMASNPAVFKDLVQERCYSGLGVAEAFGLGRPPCPALAATWFSSNQLCGLGKTLTSLSLCLHPSDGVMTHLPLSSAGGQAEVTFVECPV